MKAQYAEKVLLATTPKGSSVALAPTAPLAHGPAGAQSPRDAQERADAARLPRWGPKASILEAAASSGRFKTLGRALEDVHLDDMLTGPGPFTLFAPTDEAFAKMPSADLQSLLADKPRLRSLLSYHVVASKVRAPREGASNTATAVDGRTLTMTVRQGYYKVNDAQIVKTNLRASNGVIHAIDSLLLPL
jgi:uncharacterized surface protein with fasciclin (FAS1) repeats